jgi:hypothetical protein
MWNMVSMRGIKAISSTHKALKPRTHHMQTYTSMTQTIVAVMCHVNSEAVKSYTSPSSMRRKENARRRTYQIHQMIILISVKARLHEYARICNRGQKEYTSNTSMLLLPILCDYHIVAGWNARHGPRSPQLHSASILHGLDDCDTQDSHAQLVGQA